MVQIDGNLDEALNMFVKQLNGYDMSDADRLDVAMEGAQVFEDKLREETKSKHYSTHHDETYGHAGDHIGMVKDREAGAGDLKIGAFIVGWDNRFHGINMLRVNDGWSQYTGDHFIDNLRHSSAIRKQILLTEKAKFDSILKNKGDEK